ncbi:phage tail assembly chaperone [Pseudomonas jessenii]|uniref:phage tail assembly chaperone n=1 Tax=Pseudomonas jessenii TaxID=77298 RepID=UPI0038929602
MTIFSSKSTGHFYDDAISPDLPDDAIEITHELHAALLEGQRQGKKIDFSPEDGPVLVEPPPLSPEVQAANERQWRDGRLQATDGVVSRHRDELEEGATTTLTAEQYTALQAYRRQLRDWPQGAEFPLVDHRPTAPPWLAAQTQ